MLKLSAKLRRTSGRQNNQLREKGFIPVILYGQKVKSLPLSVRASDLNRIYKEAGESTLIKMDIEGGEEEVRIKERMVLINDVSRDPVTDKIIHADLYQVKMNQIITVEAPLIFVGESEAVEKDDGVLIKNIQQLEVEALPQDLPHQIEVDISPLKTFDDIIRVKDLKVSQGVKIKADKEETIALVSPPRSQEELEALEEAPEERIEEVEVEEKEKPAEETEEEAKESETDKQEEKKE